MPNTTVLNNLIDKNEYPMIFIGSGIPKRYLEDFPSWEGLLEMYWKQVNNDRSFYSFLNSIRQELLRENPSMLESEIDYLTNIKAGTQIANMFNELFFAEKISIGNFSQKNAFKTKIPPFKKAISNVFNEYKVKTEMHEEFDLFKKVLNKSQIILTTNYDTLIEDAFNDDNPNKIKKYIGQRGFFEQTYGWAELYKIHGSIESPSSIIIDEEDYDKFNKNSVLISAKIISLLINSPIIFMGYSLTDMNVRNIIKDFSSSLTPKDVSDMGSRIIIVEYDEGNDAIIEQNIYDSELECEYTLIKTGNFPKIYQKLININQGVAPSEVRRYQHIIKKLVVDNGKKGSLNTLLIAPQQLNEIESRIGDERIVVALGDTANIFRMPDIMSYVYDYILNKNEIHTDIALRFVASQNSRSRIPFFKYISGVNLDNTNLNPSEKEKIKQRIASCTDLTTVVNTINKSNKIVKNSLDAIKAEKWKKDKERDVISYNITKLDENEVAHYIEKEVVNLKKEGKLTISSAMRRLLLIYDLLVNKKD
ncbi:SIR2 family protein [Aquibacillus sp. 3ASR75-11]|uniref:SIR2 family protein n=1 Tax=Terrihalobacillus insolitus TaxID=2950438 RepID=A0A9X3WQK8_9BACI|nr:SIR2 family protein [Terrihalobacillus insolitus]MDC3411886.1 SIR2 family protein [Terrihalobacillus insolitus]MDC3423435.1 SIR2 family protein [Terrihalobacillus insolitus]